MPPPTTPHPRPIPRTKVIVLSLRKSEMFCPAGPDGALAQDPSDSPLLSERNQASVGEDQGHCPGHHLTNHRLSLAFLPIMTRMSLPSSPNCRSPHAERRHRPPLPSITRRTSGEVRNLKDPLRKDKTFSSANFFKSTEENNRFKLEDLVKNGEKKTTKEKDATASLDIVAPLQPVQKDLKANKKRPKKTSGVNIWWA